MFVVFACCYKKQLLSELISTAKTISKENQENQAKQNSTSFKTEKENRFEQSTELSPSASAMNSENIKKRGRWDDDSDSSEEEKRRKKEKKKKKNKQCILTV